MRHIILTNLLNKLKILAGVLLVAVVPVSQAQTPLTDVDPPVTEKIEAETEVHVVAPTNTFYGTRGLSQTSSAEALGEGRLIFGLQGAWYQQQKGFPGGPNNGANIFTGIGAASLGLNRHVDVFVSFTGFGSTDYASNDASGLGTMGGGIQGTLPFDPTAPIRMGAQAGIYQGLSNNAINTNNADGYNYFETRTGLDFMGKLIQTLVFGDENKAFKLHFNEGLVTSAEAGTDAVLLFATGAQFNMYNTVLGIEANARTPINDISISTDPLWITPSLQFRTAYDINVTLGGDIALSSDRDGTTTRALEPYRLFGGFAFTFDTEAKKRQREKDKARQEALEKSQLKSSNRELSQQARDIAEKARADSLAQVRLLEQSQSEGAGIAERARQDSLQMANKAREDSIALANSERNLADEKSKRSEAEKQLLSTGLLLMDAVYFETNKTDISINSKPYLNIIAKMLTKYPKLRIEVSGHTDNIGNAAHNQTLSQGRAESVRSYMAQVAPELNSMLSARGYGLTQPKADNQTAEGRKHNRRTELQVLNKEALSEYNR